MLTLLNNALVFAVILCQYVASHSSKTTTLEWSIQTLPWRISHNPNNNSETIVPLPSLSQKSESAEGAYS